jgi:hypothetical protein
MNLLKKFGLTAAAGVFALTAFAVSSNAQPGRARWEGNNGRHLGWTQGRHRGWDRNDRGWRRDRYARSRYYGYQTYPTYGYSTYGYNNYGYNTYRYNPYRRGTTSTIIGYVLGGRGTRYNDGYYGSSYLTRKERRKMYKRYVKQVRRNERRYGW